MKKIFTIILLAVSFLYVKAQQKIIISGVMYDPKGSDAAIAGSTSGYPAADPAKGGFEYFQFLAVEDIDFSVTPYSVVTCVNPGSFGGAPTNGWATGGQLNTATPAVTVNRTYKFDLTSGKAKKGTYFYVGGAEKRMAGYWNSTKSTDISDANWIYAKSYADNDGDGFGLKTTGIMANSGNPVGIAVFEGTTVLETSVPIDAVFYGTSTTMSASALTATYKVTDGVNPSLGYRLPTNTDLHQATVSSPFLGMGTTTGPSRFMFLGQEGIAVPEESGTLTTAEKEAFRLDKARFLQLGGVYNDVTNTWTTSRKTSYSYLRLYMDYTGDNVIDALDANGPQLSDIEGAGATQLHSILPVVLMSLNAKTERGQVRLTWTTASEKNNDHFKLLRSTDGKLFETIGTVKGAGTSNQISTYQFLDKTPFAGTNYYKLAQVDVDGKTSDSKVVQATLGFSGATISVSTNNGVVINLNSPKAGNGSIVLSDIQGRKITSLKQQIVVGGSQIPLNNKLTQGLYIVTVQMDSQKLTTKFTIN